MRPVLGRIKQLIYGVFGNQRHHPHGSRSRAMRICMLLNECEPIMHGGATIYLAGIDNAHYFRVENIEKAAFTIPHDAFSILLSHTPEIYRQAAHAGFDLLLSGHTPADGFVCRDRSPLHSTLFCHAASALVDRGWIVDCGRAH
jgi:predicted MPP superfamily phosphohydrolase